MYETENSVEGSLSNAVRTDKRIAYDIEQEKNFGESEEIFHRIKSDGNNDSITELSWKPIKTGENYFVEKYSVDILKKLKESSVYFMECNPETIKIEIPSLETGQDFQAYISATLIDVDTNEKKTKKKSYSFTTKSSAPQLTGCSYREGVVTFRWNPVEGVENYTISIQGLSSGNPIAEKTTSGCRADFQISDDLCVGRMYKVAVSAVGKDESTWEKYLIGGDFVVTDVIAARDEKTPSRGISVTWKPPKNCTNSYSVEIYEVNENGDRTLIKTTMTNLPTSKFIELKCDTSYIAKVFARNDDIAEDGSFSNQIKTDKRFTPDVETKEDFGIPKCLDLSSARDDSTIEIIWCSVNVSENYKIAGFIITASEKASRDVIYEEKQPPETRRLTVRDVKKGRRYCVKFTTILEDLDNGNLIQKASCKCIGLKPSKTNVEKCEVENGYVTFIWRTIQHAEKYTLTVKDELLSDEDILIKTIQNKKTPQNEIRLKVEMSEKLCVGKTCMTKIKTHANDLISENDWKANIIGGDLVPRNVSACVNKGNPYRSVIVTFDAPGIGAAESYKVVSFPDSIINNTKFPKHYPVVVEYLRQGTEYYFEVSARHGETWSEMSQSNSVTTQRKVGTTDQEQNLSRDYFVMMESSTVYKVRDMKTLMEKRDDKNVVTLEWKGSSLSYDSDYKVEKFKTKVSNGMTFYTDFEKGRNEYRNEEFELELGQTYDVSISTIFIDIDKNEYCQSSPAKHTIVTHPSQPIVTTMRVKNDNKLEIAWDLAKGAEYYIVKVFTENWIGPLYISEIRKKTIYEQQLDENTDLGKTYFAFIEAVGSDGKKNCIQTKTVTFGGPFVPRCVRASFNSDELVDRRTQIYLEWEPPVSEPTSYEISLINNIKCHSKFLGKTKCIVSNLSAATEYVFMVTAIYKGKRETESKSAFSNKVVTNSKSVEISNIQTEAGPNPSTSVVIKWEEVNAAKDNKDVQYRIITESFDEKPNKILITRTKYATIWGLEPDTHYLTTIFCDNGAGFEKCSGCRFKTARGKAEHVNLVTCDTAASSQMVLRYSVQDEIKVKYFATLYKDQVKISEPTEVQDGHVFKELQANTRYYAELHAVFENGETGISVKSVDKRTAPPQPKIINFECCSDDGEFSSKDLFVEWKIVDELIYYEVRITFEGNGSIEKELIINNGNKVRYSCQHEACEYSVQVRTKREEFGDWSERKRIILGPSMLQGVKAYLDNSNDTVTILCHKSQDKSPQYCMQPMCKGVEENEVKEISHGSVDGELVRFTYLPQKPAHEYSFLLWAKNRENMSGIKRESNAIISRPEKVKNVLIKPAKESSSMKIRIEWDIIERCDAYEIIIRRSKSEARECLTRVENTTFYEHLLCHPEDEYTICVRTMYKSIGSEWSRETKSQLGPVIVNRVTVLRDKDIPDRKIRISWNKINLCGVYEVWVQCTNSNTPECTRKVNETKYDYLCNNPGHSYTVRVRGLSEHVVAEWSRAFTIQLAPPKIENVKVNITSNPYTVYVAWTPLKKAPENYLVKFYQDDEEQQQKKTQDTHLIFKLKGGSTYYCTVSAQIDDVTGLPQISKKKCIEPVPEIQELDVGMVQRKISVTNDEEVIAWARDQSGKLTQLGKQISQQYKSQSAFKVQYFCISDDHPETNDTNKLIEKLRLSSSGQKFEIELCNRDTIVHHLRLLRNEFEVTENKITALIVSYMENIDMDVMKAIFEAIRKCKVKSLTLEYVRLNDDSVDTLEKCLRDEKVFGLDELNIGYVEKINSSSFKKIGKILRENGIGSFKGINCHITKDKLQNFIRGLDSPKGHCHTLKELDLSCNTHLSKHLFSTMVKLVKDYGVKSLKLKGCNLTNDVIDEFDKCIEKTANDGTKIQLEELDVSYNYTIEPGSSLYSLVANCGVTRLSLAGCMPRDEHLLRIKPQIQKKIKLDKFNINENPAIGTSIHQVANLAKCWDISELNISNCMLSVQQLMSFKESLGKKSFFCLHLGDQNRQPEDVYIEAICDLFKNIKKMLHLQFDKFRPSSRSILLDRLEKSTRTNILIKVKFSDGSAEELQKVQTKKTLRP